MPPKKKRIDSSQLQLSFGKDNSQEMCLVQSTEDAATAGTTSTSTTNRRGSWHEFASVKWLNKYPWLLVKGDGVYCQYCSTYKSVLIGGSAIFVSEPFTGVRPDKLLQHDKCNTHESAASSYREHIS